MHVEASAIKNVRDVTALPVEAIADLVEGLPCGIALGSFPGNRSDRGHWVHVLHSGDDDVRDLGQLAVLGFRSSAQSFAVRQLLRQREAARRKEAVRAEMENRRQSRAKRNGGMAP